MVSDESSPLGVDIFGEAGHVVIRVFAHLIHCVAWKTATAPSGLVGQILLVLKLKQLHTFLIQTVPAKHPEH